jgi:hypothetical protein
MTMIEVNGKFSGPTRPTYPAISKTRLLFGSGAVAIPEEILVWLEISETGDTVWCWTEPDGKALLYTFNSVEQAFLAVKFLGGTVKKRKDKKGNTVNVQDPASVAAAKIAAKRAKALEAGSAAEKEAASGDTGGHGIDPVYVGQLVKIYDGGWRHAYLLGVAGASATVRTIPAIGKKPEICTVRASAIRPEDPGVVKYEPSFQVELDKLLAKKVPEDKAAAQVRAAWSKLTHKPSTAGITGKQARRGSGAAPAVSQASSDAICKLYAEGHSTGKIATAIGMSGAAGRRHVRAVLKAAGQYKKQ